MIPCLSRYLMRRHQLKLSQEFERGQSFVFQSLSKLSSNNIDDYINKLNDLHYLSKCPSYDEYNEQYLKGMKVALCKLKKAIQNRVSSC